MQVSDNILIHEMMARAARQYGTRAFLRHGRSELTYERLDLLATQLSEQIRSRGLAGQHGAVFIENSIEFALAYFAIARAGGVVVPMPAGLPPARLASELAFCDVAFVITTEKYSSTLREILSSLPMVHQLITVADAGRAARLEFVPLHSPKTHAHLASRRNNDAAVVMLRTSGTASHPKWVMLSDKNLMANVSAFLSLTGLDESEKALITLPLTSAGTNTTELLAYLASGVTSVLYPHPTFMLGEFCRLIEEEQVTIANVTPFILNMMLWKSAEVARATTSLRKVFFASAPIAGAHFRRLLDAFPHVQFYRGYGLTEASPRCTMLSPQFTREKLESSGLPLDGISIRIVDEAAHELGAGAIGEITVRGPNVMLGYYKQHEDTAAVLKDGWLHTGDCGFVDDRGFVYVKGRKKNIVITKGISVCPEEVEQEIMGNPEVRDAYVAGVSDDHLGESLVAYVVPREKACVSETQLKAFLKERLEPAKIPGRIAFVEELQRNHAYKLVRKPGEIPLKASSPWPQQTRFST